MDDSKYILVTLDNVDNPIVADPQYIGYYLLSMRILDKSNEAVFIQDIFEYVPAVIDDLLSCLEEKECEVISREYGIKGYPRQSFSEIASAMRITILKVRDFEDHAMANLREPGALEMLDTLFYDNQKKENPNYSRELNLINMYGRDYEKDLINEAADYKKLSLFGTEQVYGIFRKLFNLLKPDGYSAIFEERKKDYEEKRILGDPIENDRRHSTYYRKKELLQEIMNFPTESDRGTPVTRLEISPIDMWQIMNKGCLYTEDIKERFPAVFFDQDIDKKALKSVLQRGAIPIAFICVSNGFYRLLTDSKAKCTAELLSLNLRNNRCQKKELSDFIDTVESLAQKIEYSISL